MKPIIKPLPNGPYYLINDLQPKVVNNLLNSKGDPLGTIVGIALCRCGGSKNKPFCDGTHRIIGFSSENKTAETDKNDSPNRTVIKNIRRDYPGKEITIHDNRKICSHAAECVNNLSSVFKLGSRHWIDPDCSKIDDIIDTVRKFASFALS